MKLSIPNDVFVRNYGPYVYLFRQSDWAELLLKNVETYAPMFSREWVDSGDIIQQIADYYKTSPRNVSSDVNDLVCHLEQERWLVKDNERTNRYQNFASNTEQSNSEPGIDPKSVLFGWLHEHPTPFELCIDLTRACTERCVHCYVPGFQKIFLPCDSIEKVLAEFALMGGLKVKLTGGECMLHPGFEKILAVARANDMVISVLSNLTCCNAAKAQAMKDNGVAVVQVSLYGMTPETHEVVTRVKGSLAKTLQGIDLLQKVGVPIQIHCPVLRQNIVGIDAVAEFGRKKSVKTTFDAVMMSRADHGHAGECGLTDSELRNFISTHEDVTESFSACPEIDPTERVCEIGTAKICLSAEGKYYPCNGCYGYVLGDCKSQTLAEVWSGEPIKRLRELRMRDLPSCLSCRNRFLCSPCPARNFNANGDLTIPDAAMCRAANCRREIVERVE